MLSRRSCPRTRTDRNSRDVRRSTSAGILLPLPTTPITVNCPVFLCRKQIGSIIKVVRAAGTRTRKPAAFDPSVFLAKNGLGRKIIELEKRNALFSQGDAADAVFYIRRGKIKLTVISKNGKEATIALLGAGDFVGEECIAAIQPQRLTTAVALTPSTVLRISRKEMMRVLDEEKAFNELFVSYLLARNVRIQEDLVDHLFNSSEKRLARTLLLLARFGKEGTPEPVIPKISQETLAEMVGTTRSRVSFFMNRFRKLGFIEYNGTLSIHSSLLNVVLHE
jgi:CRP/FNR family transcriptional regulator, cyclic AMP receptor protein